jgi:hypothetical protein
MNGFKALPLTCGKISKILTNNPNSNFNKYKKMKTKMKSAIIVILIALGAINFNGCKKDTQNTSIPPSLPPVESMTLPLDGFNNSGLKSSNSQKSNVWFGVSAITVAVWNGVIGLTLAVPVASFAEAFKHERIQINNNLWRWSYNVNVATDVYTAELEANVSNNQVYWNMYISKTGANSFSRFKWYEGVSMPDGTSGSWTMYKSPAEHNSFLAIIWHKNTITRTSDITFSNILNGDGNKGGYIKYEKTNARLYDANYTIYGSAEAKTVAIKWNSITTSGSITVNQNNVNDGPHCWDASKADLTVCP